MAEHSINNSLTLMKAFNAACDNLGLTVVDKAKILGVHRSTYFQNLNKGYLPHSKTYELQIHFIELYTSLYQVASEDIELMNHWYRSENRGLKFAPKELCCSLEGIKAATQYLKSKYPDTL